MKPIPLLTSYKSLGYADFSYRLSSPIEIKNNKLRMKIIDGALSTAIPNIYSLDDWDNTVIYVTKDNWATEQKVTFIRGNYSVNGISAAINSLIETSFYKDIADPAFYMKVNSSIDRVYFVIDNTKMKDGFTFGIDFSRSHIYQTLGFSAVKKFTGTQSTTGDVNPEIDHFGSLINVFVDGIGSNFSILNGTGSTYLTTINLNAEVKTSTYRIDNSGDTLIEVANPNFQIEEITVRFVGDRNKRRIVTFDGVGFLSLGIQIE